jgi:hypothetical protein
VTSLCLFSLKNYVNVPSKSNIQQKFCWRLEGHWRKYAGSGSGSLSERHGSADPDPYKNFMDPQH